MAQIMKMGCRFVFFSSYLLLLIVLSSIDSLSLKIYFVFILLLELMDIQFLLSISIKELKYQHNIIRLYEKSSKSC